MEGEEGKPCTRAFKHKFPYDLPEPSTEETKKLNSKYSGYLSGGIVVPPSNYFFQGIYRNYAEDLYDFDFKSTDVVVASYPKTGTTWTQELVWLIVNGLSYEGAKKPLDERFPFLEADSVIDRRVYAFEEMKSKVKTLPGPWDYMKDVLNLPHPRTIKTHMPFSLLPPDLLDTCKVIYVTRDPRDVVVSFYHHHKLIVSHGFEGTLSEFVDDFINEKVMYSPFYAHLKEAHDRKGHPNLLIITYENMKVNLGEVIDRIASFLGKTVNSEEKEKLLDHLHISSMKNNASVNGVSDPLVRKEGFIKTGQSGGWRSQLTPEDQLKLSKWYTEKSMGLNKFFDWKD